MDTSYNIVDELTEKLSRIKEKHNRNVKKYLDSNPIQREKLNNKNKANYYKNRLKEDIIYNSLTSDEDKLEYVKMLKEVLKSGEYE